MNNFLGQLVVRALTPQTGIMPRIPSQFEPLATSDPLAGATDASAFAPKEPTVPVDATPASPQALREAIQPAKARAASISDPPLHTALSPSCERADKDLLASLVHPPIRAAPVPAIEPAIASEELLTDHAQTRGWDGATDVASSQLDAADDSGGALPKGPPVGVMELTAREQLPDVARDPAPKNSAPQTPNDQAAFSSSEGTPRSTRPRILEIHPVKAPAPASVGTSGAGSGQHAPLAPTVQITIGRVEVRAVMPVPLPARKEVPRTPHLSLDDYLKQRNGGRR